MSRAYAPGVLGWAPRHTRQRAEQAAPSARPLPGFRGHPVPVRHSACVLLQTRERSIDRAGAKQTLKIYKARLALRWMDGPPPACAARPTLRFTEPDRRSARSHRHA